MPQSPAREDDQLRAALAGYTPPSFSAIVMCILEEVRNDDTALSSIGDLVSTDPGLSVRLLGAVNSAGFGLRHRVKSIHHAVSLLGRGPLESILVSMAVRGALPRNATRGHDPARFWKTAVKRGVTARALAELLDPATASQSFTAGLLQDMAVTVLAQLHGEAYGSLLEDWHRGGEDLAALEREAFRWDHADAGAMLCRHWEFPEELTLAIASHHASADDGNGPLPAARLVAALRETDEGLGVERLVEDAHEQFGLSRDVTVELVSSSFEAAEELSGLLG